MPTEISRRTLLGGLAATATLASTSCDSRPTHSGRVNLICHGMLMFHWVKDADYINILVPDPPIVHDTPFPHEAHKLLFSEWRGGKGNRFFTPGDFELRLEGEFTREKSKWKKGPNRSEEVVLNSSDATTFRTGCMGPLKLNEVRKHRYAVKVPFPTDVLPLRRTTFGTQTAYKQGPKTAEDFKVDTKVLAGVHVLVYDGVKSQAILRYLADTSFDQPLGPAGVPQSVNLYIYSQPDNWADMFQGHIQQFNQLVTYEHYDGKAAGAVILDLNPIGTSQGTEPPVAVDDLEAEDLMTLVELNSGQIAPVQGKTHAAQMQREMVAQSAPAQAAAQVKSEAPKATGNAVAVVPTGTASQVSLKGQDTVASGGLGGVLSGGEPPHIMLADPVECLQGWGT